MESGGGQARGGWINESVYLVSVGGWVCVCVGVLSVGLGPGLDSMSPARSRRSASHAAGTHGRLPQKTGRPGLRRGGVGGYNLHSVPPNSPPDCGTPTTSRLYPFGAHVFVYSRYRKSRLVCVVVGPRLVSTSPAFMRSCASHPAWPACPKKR